VSVLSVVSLVALIETIALLIVIVKVPLASAKRPVPPVIVLTWVLPAVGDVNTPDPVKVENSSSPFAATRVSVPVDPGVTRTTRVAAMHVNTSRSG